MKSVLVMTSNHVPLIRQAIDSVLAQETTLARAIVISEDRSTDGTRDIVIEYARHFPDRIRVLLSDRNLHSLVSGDLRACHGDFVALLEGDDYWTDPTKLQRQVEFLDEHAGQSARDFLVPAVPSHL